MNRISRRNFLSAAALAGGSVIAAGPSIAVAEAVLGRSPRREPKVRLLEAKHTWTLPPALDTTIATVAALPGGARLWYWDTGGSGEAVVLAHAGTGSGLHWEYQQSVFANAGYRVIGYSARGKYGSDPVLPGSGGTASGDLHELIEFLGIDRFHLVGTAAGGGNAVDYAISHQDRLLSLVIANSLGGITEPTFTAVTNAILPSLPASPPFGALPATFRELGPSYRSGFPDGAARWDQLVKQSGAGLSNQGVYANAMLWPAVETVRTPTLVLTGDADLYMPPWRVRDFARHLRNSEITVIAEVGHSAFWEQPEVFNRELLRFFDRNCGHGHDHGHGHDR